MRVVYLIINLENGKVYVGQTKNFANRKRGHLYDARRGSTRPLYRSIRKHGEENFKFEVIEECEDDLINEREQYWVSHYDSFNPKKGYNLTSGGNQGKLVSKTTKVKLSQSLKGNKHCVGRQSSPETRDKLRKCGKIKVQNQLGSIIIEERTCKKCSKKFTVKFREKQKKQGNVFCSRSCGNARTHSEKTKKMISQSLQRDFDPSVHDRIVNGDKLTCIANETGISYSTLKKLKKRLIAFV